jgi:hypothetical protein
MVAEQEKILITEKEEEEKVSLINHLHNNYQVIAI